MTALTARYPADDEVAVIAADAWLMPKADTAEEWKLNAGIAIPLLEAVLKRAPDYTLAVHFYIHPTEMASTPGLAEHYADRLPGLAPRASDLAQMESGDRDSARREAAAALAYRVKDPGTLALLHRLGKETAAR